MKKSNNLKTLCRLAVLTFIGAPIGSALATDGYFSHGYGMKAKGMGGASVATAQDAFAGANNPASAVWAGNRLEGGVDIFMPKRGMSRTASGLGPVNVDSGANTFLVPELGYNKIINDSLAVGVTVFGNGGMNTEYAGGQLNCGAGPNTANVLCGSGKLGVDLMQLIVAPTVAYKFSEQHSIGVSPLLVYQKFKVDGLQAFTLMSSDSSKLSNNGYSTSTGVGVRLGYFGKLSESVNIGASYSPKTKMGKFGDYAGLFAGGGGFDIPENYALGVSVQATSALLVAMDYQRINYSKVPSIGNPSTNQAFLGTANGPGFGWRDISVWKLGAQWQATPQLALRTGVNISQNPVQSENVTFNILAPGVVTSHFTLGATYALSPSTELTVAYMQAPKRSVTGSSLFNTLSGPGAGGNETIYMSQRSLGVQFGQKF